MRETTMRPLAAIWLSTLFSLALTGAATAAGDSKAGRVLAIDACSACHKVTPGQTRPAPVQDPDEGVGIQAPDFTWIARKYARRPRALRRYIQAPVHPMREQVWDTGDLDAVVAFIRTIRN
jgi:mono/diheme cytochrome c family protein